MAQEKTFKVRDYCETLFSDLTLMKSKSQSYVRKVEEMGGSEESFSTIHIAHFKVHDHDR